MVENAERAANTGQILTSTEVQEGGIARQNGSRQGYSEWDFRAPTVAVDHHYAAGAVLLEREPIGYQRDGGRFASLTKARGWRNLGPDHIRLHVPCEPSRAAVGDRELARLGLRTVDVSKVDLLRLYTEDGPQDGYAGREIQHLGTTHDPHSRGYLDLLALLEQACVSADQHLSGAVCLAMDHTLGQLKPWNHRLQRTVYGRRAFVSDHKP